MEKIYANQAVCHMKNSNWKRVVETCDSVRPCLPKAMCGVRLLTIFPRPWNSTTRTSKLCSGRAKRWARWDTLRKRRRSYKLWKSRILTVRYLVLPSPSPSVLYWRMRSVVVDTTAVDAEISRLRKLDDERDRANRKKLKGMSIPSDYLSFYR